MCKCFRDSYVPFKYFGIWYDQKQGFPGGESGKEPACQYRRRKRCRFDPRVGKISWRRAWQPTPVSLPGEFHRQRSLASCSPRVTQSGTQLNRLSTHAHNQKQLDRTTLPRAQQQVWALGLSPRSQTSTLGILCA